MIFIFSHFCFFPFWWNIVLINAANWFWQNVVQFAETWKRFCGAFKAVCRCSSMFVRVFFRALISFNNRLRLENWISIPGWHKFTQTLIRSFSDVDLPDEKFHVLFFFLFFFRFFSFLSQSMMCQTLLVFLLWHSIFMPKKKYSSLHYKEWFISWKLSQHWVNPYG